MHNKSFATILQGFFLEGLINQKHVSPQTVYSYRDSFRVFFSFLRTEIKKDLSKLTLENLNAPTILKFLDYLEDKRKNSIQTRNTRLTAIKSLFRYLSYLEPAAAETIQRVLAIPFKRTDQPEVNFLSKEEISAIINAPNLSKWSGNRDHVMFMTLYNTGARVSEIIGIQISDVAMDIPAYVKIHGKGRKNRTLPLLPCTRKLIKNWLNYLNGNSNGLLFPNRQGKKLTRHGAEYRLHRAKDIAANKCPSLKEKQVTPHSIRHSTAIHLLQAGVDISLISLWLGHADISTTYKYLGSDLIMKEKSLRKLESPLIKMKRFRPNESFLDFIDDLKLS